jgi:glutamyl-tRNA reductase
MLVGILGVSHKSACLSLREKLAKGCTTLKIPFPAAILSTCNRFEIYYSCDVLAEGQMTLLNMLREEIDLDFEQHLYSFFGIDCFSHLVRVSSGLDSAVIGETEIQSQVKKMYQAHQKSLNTPLHFIVQKSLKLSKQLRNASIYPCRGVTLERLIYEKLHSNTVLFIGNSAINRRIWSYLRLRGKTIKVVSRSPVEGVERVDLSEWHLYECIVSATHANGYLIDALPDEKRRQFFDLSIPRTICPKLSGRQGTTLYNIDQLGQEVQSAQTELDDCSEVVERLVERQEMLFFKNRKFHSAPLPSL